MQMEFKIFWVFLLSALCFLAISAEEKAAVMGKTCEPGEEIKKDCSRCTCNQDGTELTCEKQDCSENNKVSEVLDSKGETCTPGELFKNKCNECVCPNSGLKSQASCTIIGCPDD